MADDGTNPGITQDGAPGFLQGVGQFLTGSNNPITNSMMVPAMAQAYQQWNNAGQYQQLGQDAANRADPFGKYRGYYGDMLQGLYKDPSQIENTPGYKFAMNQALNATTSKMNSQGYAGSSTAQNALAAQASGLAQQTWNTEANRLAQLSGSQFDPANAANMMMRGGELAVGSQNAALAALFSPFGPNAGGNTTINNNNGSSSSGGNGLRTNTNDALNRLQQAGMNPQTAANLLRTLVNDPSQVSQGDLNTLESLGIYDGSGYTGVDSAPGGYDYTGFGGNGTASGDPTLQGINFGGGFDPSNYYDVTGQTGFDPGSYTSSGTDMTGFQVPITDLFG